VLLQVQSLPTKKSISVSPYSQSGCMDPIDKVGSVIEHAEVFPVDIKMDYKPRRVDYRALREGKTIELMNFFHFDGSEMTLRHITLSGVSSRMRRQSYVRLTSCFADYWLAAFL
jgi:hypothetical protein